MARRNWTHDELLLAFNLYCKLPFGSFHQHNPDVIALSRVIDRTPSAVAMKLSNFAALDPQQKSRGIKGFGNYSAADEMAWAEFTSDWEKTFRDIEVLVSKYAFEIADESENEVLSTQFDDFESQVNLEPSQTEVERVIKARIGQRFFRKTTLANYSFRCCVCNLSIPSMLVASHIVPWKDRWDLRLNPHNGLSMCVLHDKAFDTGFLTVDDQYRVIVSEEIAAYLPNESIEVGIFSYHGKPISLPDKFMPKPEFLRHHFDRYFLKA